MVTLLCGSKFDLNLELFYYSKSSNINFTDEAKAHAIDTEKTFGKQECKYDFVSPRLIVPKISANPVVDSWRIAKVDGPDPGSYDMIKSFDDISPKAFNYTI